jgi:hypothetical protein
MGPGFTGKYLAYTEAKVSGQRKSFIELTQERTSFQLASTPHSIGWTFALPNYNLLTLKKTGGRTLLLTLPQRQ